MNAAAATFDALRQHFVVSPRQLDRPFCLAVVTLLALGLVMVASASVAVAESMTGNPMYYFFRQLIYTAMGLAVGAGLFCVPMTVWARHGFWLLALALFLLMLVLIPGVGREVNGARRWIHLPLFSLQASEPARLALVVYLAGYLVRRQAEFQNSLSGLMRPLFPIGLACGLLLLEPDFGAAAVLAGVVFLMLFLAGARLLYLFLPVLAAGGAFAYLATSQAYRLRRILSFRDPFADIENTGWQLSQSLIAIGRGEWFGVGLGNSVQKLLYLPEQYTDFIYAIYAEEFGLAGTVVLLALYGVLSWRGFEIGRVAEQQGERFRAYLCYGLTGWIGGQAMLNLAVNTGLLPTKGLTLPLLSYGGSSLITFCAMLALILRVDHENRRAVAGRPTGVRT